MTRYSPGDWYGVVTPAGVAMLPRTVPMSAVERVWMDLRTGGGLGALIDGLVGAFGTSLSRLPEFGVIALSPDGEVRVAIRGQVTVRLWLLGADDPTLVSGTGVTTWNERLWTGVGRAELFVGDISADAADELLPVVDGVLRARLLHVAVLDFDTQPPPDRPDDRLAPADLAVESPASEPSTAADLSSTDDSTPGWLEPLVDPLPLSDPAVLPVEGTEALEAEGSDPVQPDAPTPESEPEVGVPPEQVGPDGASETVLPAAEPESGPGSPPAPGQTTMIELVPDAQPESDYDRLLFGETMMASAESAAVRIQSEEAVEPATQRGPGELNRPEPVRPEPPAPMQSLPPVPPPLPAGLIAGIPSFGAPPPPPPPAAPAAIPAPWADHDGETVMVDDLRAALAAQGSPAVPAGRPPRLLLPGQPPIILDRSAIIGSRPRLSRVQGGSVPQLITVQSPSGEISRSHLEIRVEHGAVLAVDLNSTNGTVLLRAGADPMRLHPGEAYMLVAGDRVDLGDGIALSFEGLT